MIFCYIIIIHDHLYTSLLPGFLRDKPAVQHMCRVQSIARKISVHTVQNSRTHGLMLLRSLLLFNTSLWGFSVFSWCNMLGSWQSCRAFSAPSKRHSISPNVLWLEFWSFKIFFFHTCFLSSPSLFSLFSPQFSLLQPLCLCKSQNHRIMSSSSSCGEPRSLLQPRASLIWILFKSTITLIVRFPWKVILSLKPINAGSFKITFALL